MRITSQMCQNYAVRNITSSYNAAIKLSNHIASSRQVLDLQDNPTSAITGIRMQQLIAKAEQYTANIAAGTGALDLTDAKLGSIKSLLDEAMSLLVGSASESTTADERQADAVELNSLLQQILQLANAKDGERYLFGGTDSGGEPFSASGKYVIYNGNDQSINVQTGDNATTAINCAGSDAFGSMTTVVASGDLNPGVNLCTDVSTSLSALNGGSGVPSGKILVCYSAYPQGLEVDISGCDTLEDVKDCIERATLEASLALDPAACSWLDGSTLDWRDLQDRYVKVTMNPDGNGISLQEFDLGEALPEPTAKESKQGLDYSGAPGYQVGGGGSGIGAGTVYDKPDYIYGNGSGAYAALRVDDVAGNKVAAALGIKGTANRYDPANPDDRLDGFIHGSDLNPAVTKSTLLADLEGYNDAVYTITNGDKPGIVTVRETSDDSGFVFSNWNLDNLARGYNTGADGELYARVTRRGAPDNDIYVELYAVPPDRAKASDLVATGTCSQADGGTVVLTEANNSGVGGSVGILLPTTGAGAEVSLAIEWEENRQAVVHVPAFVEESNPDGSPKDSLDLLSGWQISGLDKPPAGSYDLNHPPSTDPDGDVSVNLRTVDNGDGTSSVILEIYRPAYDDQPATLVATGELNLGGTPPLDTAASGRIAITGVEGFEAVSGSVYLEVPAGAAGADIATEFTLTATFATVEDLMRAVEEAGIDVSVGLSADGKGIEFQSRTAGAHLTISEDTDCYEQLNDAYGQLSALDLSGLVKGVNCDGNGQLHMEVVYYPPDAGRTDGKAVLLSDSGEQILVEAGYYVRIYSDADALAQSYENRDNASLVAEGYVPAGEWDGSDPANPYAPTPAATTPGSAHPLVLEERNGSGVTGTVDFDYYGGRDQAVADASGEYDYSPYTNAGITIAPGGLRSESSIHTTLQEIDVAGFVPGVHSDFAGTAHGTIAKDAATGTITVAIHRDSSRSHMSAKGELNADTGRVTLYETDKNGEYTLDANGNRIEVGSLVVAANSLPAGGSDSFTIASGGLDLSGQEREDNLFSTVADILDAMHANDAEALHNLIDTLQADIDRLLEARSGVSARSQRLDMLSDRYADDIVSYSATYTATVGMDADALAKALLEYQSAENAYNAALSVSSRYLQMSLLSYL